MGGDVSHLVAFELGSGPAHQVPRSLHTRCLLCNPCMKGNSALPGISSACLHSLERALQTSLRCHTGKPPAQEAAPGALTHATVADVPACAGGFRPQAQVASEAVRVINQAKALQDSGCFAIVLECIPAPIAAAVTEALSIPTIGIGAGPQCSGQVGRVGRRLRGL